MRIMLTDETNRKRSANAKFLVYGGLIFEVDQLSDVDATVEAIRAEAGYRAQDDFKFDTNTRPKHVSVQAATAAKRKVVEMCSELDAQFIAYVALHDIIKSRPPDEQVLFAANTVISQYNKYLERVARCDGICIVDNLPVKGEWQYLSEKFTLGLEAQGAYYPVSRIKMFAATCNNASHASSVMDIVLGSFRYCINNPQNMEAACEMMGNVVELMWHEKVDDTIHAYERGLVMRPLLGRIKVQHYKDEYVALHDHINRLLVRDGAEGN